MPSVAWLENEASALARRFNAKGQLGPYLPISEGISLTYSVNADIDGVDQGTTRSLAEQIVLSNPTAFWSTPAVLTTVPSGGIAGGTARTRAANNAARAVGAGWNYAAVSNPWAQNSMLGWELDTDGAGGLYLISVHGSSFTRSTASIAAVSSMRLGMARGTAGAVAGVVAFNTNQVAIAPQVAEYDLAQESYPRFEANIIAPIAGTTGETEPLLVGVLNIGGSIANVQFSCSATIVRLTDELPTFPFT